MILRVILCTEAVIKTAHWHYFHVLNMAVYECTMTAIVPRQQIDAWV